MCEAGGWSARLGALGGALLQEEAGVAQSLSAAKNQDSEVTQILSSPKSQR